MWGNYAKMLNNRNRKRDKSRTMGGGSRICKIQRAGGSPPPTKESGLPECFNFH